MKLLPSFTGQPERNRIYHTEFFELCGAMPDNSVDMILCDLPYGTTACEWDNRIPLEPMWAAFKRIIKPNGAIVLTASQPFTSMLVMSASDIFNHEWIWIKRYHSNPFLAKQQPLRKHESVLVFGCSVDYYPLMIDRPKEWMRKRPSYAGRNGMAYGNKPKNHHNNSDNPLMFPSNILEFDIGNPNGRALKHPTQKPVALFEYLIKTYTLEGQLVFDPCVGSGTTAVAAKNTSRDYICGDMMLEYVEIARKRVNPVFGDPPKRKREVLSMDSLPLFEGVM